MKMIKEDERQNMTLPKQVKRYCNGERLDYILQGDLDGVDDRFCISVTGFGEHAEVSFWAEYERALHLFDKIADGNVPPCALREILDDQLSL